MDAVEKSQNRFGMNLKRIVKGTEKLEKIGKSQLEVGDYLFVKTINSLYSICKKENNQYEVSGGWFDRKGLSPAVLSIRGCTWGGSIIHLEVVAACGLFLEFGNNLTTSPIRKIVVIKARQLN